MFNNNIKIRFNSFLGLLGAIIFIVIPIILLAFLVSSLIFWGIGNLVIWVFKINYTWTIWHGLAVSLLFSLLCQTFNGKK